MYGCARHGMRRMQIGAHAPLPVVCDTLFLARCCIWVTPFLLRGAICSAIRLGAPRDWGTKLCTARFYGQEKLPCQFSLPY